MKFVSSIASAAIFVLGTAFSATAHAETLSDTDKENRWAEQIIDTLFDGEPIWLNARKHDFLAIEIESLDGDSGHAAIVIHGIGIHPNWDTVIRPLRVGLTEHGWHTLSIQMPILPNEAKSAEYEPLLGEVADRIAAAIDYLKNKGQEHIVIIAHSLGATMTMRYLEEVPETDILGLVLIGMQGGAGGIHDNAATLEKHTLPILDLYGSEDLPGVVDYAERKASTAMKAGNSQYRQKMIDGADHFFTGRDETLISTVGEWLENTKIQ